MKRFAECAARSMARPAGRRLCTVQERTRATDLASCGLQLTAIADAVVIAEQESWGFGIIRRRHSCGEVSAIEYEAVSPKHSPGATGCRLVFQPAAVGR